MGGTQSREHCTLTKDDSGAIDGVTFTTTDGRHARLVWDPLSLREVTEQASVVDMDSSPPVVAPARPANPPEPVANPPPIGGVPRPVVPPRNPYEVHPAPQVDANGPPTDAGPPQPRAVRPPPPPAQPHPLPTGLPPYPGNPTQLGQQGQWPQPQGQGQLAQHVQQPAQWAQQSQQAQPGQQGQWGQLATPAQPGQPAQPAQWHPAQPAQPTQPVQAAAQQNPHRAPAASPPPPPPRPVAISAQRRFIKIPNPTQQDLLLAASIFSEIAAWSNLKYALIGGVSALILGGQRRTKTLDILLTPRPCGDKSLLRPVINELFDRFPHLLNYSQLNRKGHVVVIRENAGVAINFIDCVNNIFGFPEIVVPGQTADSDPTICYQLVHPPHISCGVYLPVVLPRLLLQQRIQYFIRPEERELLSRKRNDVHDIVVYLNALQSTDNESFTDEEAVMLMPKIKEVLKFAEMYFLRDAIEVDKWLYVNIPLVEGDWKL